MSRQRFIVVDVGTSFIKGAIADLATLELQSIERLPFPERLADTHDLYHEVDPREVVESTRGLIERLASKTEVQGGVLLAGQMGGLVLSDSRGEARTNYISWLDKRTLMAVEGESKSVFERFVDVVGEDGRRRLGNEVRAPLTLVFLSWLRDRGQLPDAVIPVTLLDYVAGALTESRPVIEWTSATGLVDVFARDFPRDLIAKLGLDGLDWPELVGFREPVGTLRAGRYDLPVYPPVGDHQAALTGTLIEQGELSINISTGSQVAMVSAEAISGEYQIRPFFDGACLNSVTNIPAGRALNALVALLSELGERDGESVGDPWPYIFAEAEKVEEPELRADLAFFPSPVTETGALSGLCEDNMTVGQVVSASISSMAEYYERFALRLSPDRSWSRVVFSGGLAQKSKLLRARVMQRLGGPWRIAPFEEDTLTGLMILGLVVAGVESTVADARRRLGGRVD
ncbi:MAG: FGGY family carbohydrate kinase [Planctomycetota bacterium]